MKQIFATLFILVCCRNFTANAQKLSSDTAGGYRLIWSDEFLKDGPPNPANWKFEHGFVRNNELQWYQTQNAFCKDGLLVIEARREHKANPKYNAAGQDWRTKRSYSEYTSSSINTNGLHHWKFGRFIMRAKFNTDLGLWPAFWTLGSNKSWPSNGEIDIMEYYRNELLANIAHGTAKPWVAKWFTTKRSIDSLAKNLATEFHVWRMDWDENSISLYFDDVLMNRVALEKLVNQDGSNFNPFKQPHYILLNLAVGGDNGGDPTLTVFPRRFEVDYVRVFQK